MKRKLKLFVFTEYCSDYTDGLAFAIAYDVEEAKKLINKHKGFESWEWGNVHVHRLDRKIAYAVCGGG